jgi:hypothetical protein
VWHTRDVDVLQARKGSNEVSPVNKNKVKGDGRTGPSFPYVLLS